jgi:penicillin-insensitive murein DD-endopeptidase
MRLKRTLIGLGGAALVLAAATRWGNDILILYESSTPSTSFGSPVDGSIQNSKRLPSSGQNFSTFSRFGSLIGRTCVHDRVRATMLDAYARLAVELPGREFAYGETGWPHGGRLWPHKTHANGLSVDFVVPVNNFDGTPTVLPMSVFNKFGYGVEFDSTGATNSLRIDFDAMAAHLKAIRSSALSHGLDLVVVIFDRQLQKRLFASKGGRDLPELIHFSVKPPWTRHDAHYHIDFAPQ